MKMKAMLCVLVISAMPSWAQQENVSVMTGPFDANWESLSAWECPEWFRDAKFGIWAHWDPQCEAEDGDWYARSMYSPNSGTLLSAFSAPRPAESWDTRTYATTGRQTSGIQTPSFNYMWMPVPSISWPWDSTMTTSTAGIVPIRNGTRHVSGL